MGPKYNAATSFEEMGNTKQYRKSKRLSKRVKEVPNLAQTGSHIAADGIGCKWEGKAHQSFNISYTKTYRYRRGKS